MRGVFSTDIANTNCWKFETDVDLFAHRCRLNFTEDDIMWAIGGSTLNWSTIFFCHAILRFILSSWFAGLLKTNTIMFGESGGRGLFPMFSLMNHSCRLEASTYKHSMLKCTVHFFLKKKILSINLLNHVVSGPTLSTHSTPRKSKILQKLHLSFICNLIQN